MIYQEVNESITAHDIARWLGLDVKGNLIICPFHADKNPSMYVYKDSFYCFSCGRHEDNIGMVAAMKGISNSEALKVINSAFSLGFNIGDHTETEDEKIERAIYKRSRVYESELEKEKNNALDIVAAVCRLYGKDGYDTAHIEELHDNLLMANGSSARWWLSDVAEYENILKNLGLTPEEV